MKKLAILLLALTLVISLTACIGFYTVTVEDEWELLYEQPAKVYRAGENVVIKTHIVNDTNIECYVNGICIGRQTPTKTGEEFTHWEYHFDMPAENVVVTFEFCGEW